MDYVFPAAALPCVAVLGTTARFPVHRIYCVGRNYAEHAREMGATVDRGAPVFFMKPADAVVEDGAAIAYPPGTSDLHHEVELVVALRSGGRDIAPHEALDCVFGYGVGLDLTRRDLQAAAKAKGLPWDVAKGFDCSAPVSAIAPVARIGHPSSGLLWLDVNGERRQQCDIAEMVFRVPEILAALSRLYLLQPGDLIFTGTPAGVAALHPGDGFRAGFEDVLELRGSIR